MQKQETNSELNLTNIEFIIAKLNELAPWSFDDYKRHWEEYPEDKFHNLPLPDGRHLCSTKAISESFEDLALRNTASDKEQQSYDLDSYIKELKAQFVHVFIDLKRQLNRRECDRMVDKALNRLKQQRVTKTHFIPCSVVTKSNPLKFEIGPVTFYPANEFFNQYKNSIERTEKVIFDQGDRDEQSHEENDLVINVYKQKIGQELNTFFRDLGWVAKVTVPLCLTKISRLRAKAAVNATLDILKLFLGDEKGQEFYSAYDSDSKFMTIQLECDGAGVFNVGWRKTSPGAIVDEDWYEFLQKNFNMMLKLAGATVNSLLEPSASHPLPEKWLGALLWYGQAISEKSDAAKIIKYVAALEQLTMTKKTDKNNVTTTVTNRTMYLCGSILEQDNENHDTKEAIKKLYSYRCDLLHGTLSPASPKTKEMCRHAGRITQQALYSALQLFVNVSTEKKDRLEDLEDTYARLVTSTI